MVDVWDPQKVVGCRMTRFAREFCAENSLQDAISMPGCFFNTKNQIAEDDARVYSSTSIRRQYDAVGFFLDAAVLLLLRLKLASESYPNSI
jgi:hypothetical protein